MKNSIEKPKPRQAAICGANSSDAKATKPARTTGLGQRDRVLVWLAPIFGIAAIVFAPMLNPQTPAESFVSAMLEALGTVAICYALLLVFRRRK